MLTPAPTPRLGRRAESVNRTDAVRRVTGLLYFFFCFVFYLDFLFVSVLVAHRIMLARRSLTVGSSLLLLP